MRALFNNYEWDSGKEQVVTDEHIREQNAFLDAIIETEVIKILMQFFKEKSMKFVTFIACLSNNLFFDNSRGGTSYRWNIEEPKRISWISLVH